MNEAPILVTGLVRSGTTWMQWFLSQHPRIHVHGQSPGISWHLLWSFYQTFVEQGAWAQDANRQVGYQVAHYAGSGPERAGHIYRQALRDYLTGFGPALKKPRWGLKWPGLCIEPGAAEQVESLWPDVRWVVCLRDPFVTIDSTRNTFVPSLDPLQMADAWLRTCRFLQAHPSDRVALFQIDKVSRATEADRYQALLKVLACVGEEPRAETDRFVRQWPVVHKVRTDQDRMMTLSDEDKQDLLRKVPELGRFMQQMGYEVTNR